MKDEQIINEIKDRKESAISYVMDRYSRLAWSVSSSVLCGIGTEQDVEECVADVFIFLWLSPEKYDAQRGSLKSYISLVSRSRAIDRYREIVRRAAEPLDENMICGDVINDNITKEEMEIVSRAVAALPQEERDVINMRLYYGKKPRDIAKALDCPVKKVDNLLYRAKKRLREVLLKEGITDETDC